MKILNRQELSLSILKPLGAQAGLALGAVSIVAGVVGLLLMTAVIAL